MAGTFAPAERQYYDQLFDTIDKDQTGMLLGQDALPFLTKSGLQQQTLGEIWALSDPDNNGFLTKESWYKAARVIGWVQKGGKTIVEESLLNQPGPYPSFTGLPPPPPQAPLNAQTTGQRPLSAAPTGSGLPPLTPADRTKFTRIFVGCGPQNGLVSGDKARDVFVKSQLSYDKLGQIWTLADTQQRGSLDLPDFIIGMYLIQACMANSSLQLPATLPPGTYEQASGGRAPPAGPTSPIARQNTGPQSPVRPQYTGGALQPQRTGQSAQIQSQATPPRQGSVGPAFAGASAFGQNRSAPQQAWDVKPDAKATSDRFFAQLDQQNRGIIEGDVAVPFMLQSQLDEGSLATIWDLSDIRHEGKLDRDMFAVAMHLINQKLAGQDLPASLPNSLVPPSLRQEFGGGQQEVLDNGPSSTTQDLFDLFSDEPAPMPAQSAMSSGQPQPFSAGAFTAQAPLSNQNTGQQGPQSRQLSPTPTGTRGFVPQSAFGMAATHTGAKSPPPPSDLLGEDAAETPPAVPDDSAEIGNKRNQLENTQRNLSSLEKQQSELQRTESNNTSQLSELETNLTNARTKHDEVSKSVADLRSRVSDQQEKVKNLNMDFIAAESDLSALRSEKDELEQALLRDKEEIRGLQKRMKEVDDEKGTLKTLLEKLKKEARQQKGMVTIAKKQLSTSEHNRDLAQKDLDDHHKTADEEDEDGGMSAGTAAGLGLAGGAALGAGAGTAASFFGGGENSRSATPFGQVTSPTVGSNDAPVNVPLPATPKALSPVATGASSRSNNPFDRFRTQSRVPDPPVPQAQSPAESQNDADKPISSSDEVAREEAASPSSLGAGALAGATTAVGLAAGVAVAGASAVYDAAKDAVTGDDHEDKDESAKSIEDGEKTPKGDDNDDPFGADSGHFGSAKPEETDAFGAPSSAIAAAPKSAPTDTDTDPFGAPARSGDDTFDSGFGDSFGASTGQKESSTTGPSGNADFDSAFADFDDAPKTAEPTSVSTGTFGESSAESGPISPGIPMGVPKSALPNLRPENERSDSTQAIAPGSEVGTPGDVTPVDNQSPASRQDSGAPAARADDDVSSDEEDDGPEDLEQPMRAYGSSTRLPEAANEHEAEVVPAPAASIAPAPVAVQSSTSSESAQKGRRSAPPPPASRGSSVPPLAAPITAASTDDFDPFGAPATSSQPPTQSADDDFDPFGAPSTSSPTQAESSSNTFGSLPPGAAAPAQSAQPGQPQTSKFDDDDFDFSDMPPAQVDTSEQTSQQPTSAQKANNTSFDDEFSGFDDEFESVPTNPNSGSDRSNISKSFEMVTPTQEGSQQQQQPPTQQSGGSMDEWGMAGSGVSAPTQQRPQPTSAFSFDDAFGGDFEPAPPAAQGQSQEATSQSSQYAPPPGPPPAAGGGATLAKPTLPDRKPSAAGTGPQPDDLEDVKRLCSMGFPRELAVGALESNAYDFQKALNVLLSN